MDDVWGGAAADRVRTTLNILNEFMRQYDSDRVLAGPLLDMATGTLEQAKQSVIVDALLVALRMRSVVSGARVAAPFSVGLVSVSWAAKASVAASAAQRESEQARANATNDFLAPAWDAGWQPLGAHDLTGGEPQAEASTGVQPQAEASTGVQPPAGVYAAAPAPVRPSKAPAPAQAPPIALPDGPFNNGCWRGGLGGTMGQRQGETPDAALDRILSETRAGKRPRRD